MIKADEQNPNVSIKNEPKIITVENQNNVPIPPQSTEINPPPLFLHFSAEDQDISIKLKQQTLTIKIQQFHFQSQCINQYHLSLSDLQLPQNLASIFKNVANIFHYVFQKRQNHKITHNGQILIQYQICIGESKIQNQICLKLRKVSNSDSEENHYKRLFKKIQQNKKIQNNNGEKSNKNNVSDYGVCQHILGKQKLEFEQKVCLQLTKLKLPFPFRPSARSKCLLLKPEDTLIPIQNKNYMDKIVKLNNNKVEYANQMKGYRMLILNTILVNWEQYLFKVNIRARWARIGVIDQNYLHMETTYGSSDAKYCGYSPYSGRLHKNGILQREQVIKSPINQICQITIIYKAGRGVSFKIINNRKDIQLVEVKLEKKKKKYYPFIDLYESPESCQIFLQ